MRFTFVCDIVLLVFLCVALADQDINNNITGSTECDVKDIVDYVLFQPQTCDATHPCQNGGTCVEGVCRCLNNTSGDLCQNVEGCESKCLKVDCVYNVTSQDVDCKCRNGLVFDDTKRMCRYCDCGSYTRSCSFVKGKKKCVCYETHADQFGTCELCICKGYSSMYGCHFDSKGSMICPCLKGFAQLRDECKECDCGSNGNCTLYWGGSKSCHCEEGYAENYGTCQECNCGENGSCDFSNRKKLCYCNSGFREYKGTCKVCDCGVSSRCDFDSNGNKECTCNEGYAMNSGRCEACNCLPGKSCIFKGAVDKECICPHGYADLRGLCMACDCRMHDSNCTFSWKSGFARGIQTCHCPKGYTSDEKYVDASCVDFNECLRPQDNDCPFSTECVNKPGSYDCVCAKGFEPRLKLSWKYDFKKFGCQDIDECEKSYACYDYHAKCVNTPGSYRCDCKAGYSVQKSVHGEPKDNTCVEDARPWRTASIVVGTLFGIVIFFLLIGICVKEFEA